LYLTKKLVSLSFFVQGKLSKLKPQDLSNTAWSFATLGFRHEEFMIAAKDQLEERYTKRTRDSTTRFKGQEITNLLWSFATLNFPFSGLMTRLSPYIVGICTDSQGLLTVASIARVFKRQELANLSWICAVFGDYPADLMRVLYMGLLGVGDNPDPAYIQKVHGDSGIQRSAVMSIIYLQIAMDLDNASNGLALPSDFPERWDQGDSSSPGRGTNDLESGLKLSTSKIQRDVSAAFSRIGFSHVEEHVIRMDELAQVHGIQLDASPREILSIDIANVDTKIGIEVDGPAHFISNIDHESDSNSSCKPIQGRLEYQFDWGENQQINGPTALKKRLLEKLGWRIINIPFWEWYAMKSDEKLEEEYCRALLGDQ
jgi:hypothetical protein